MLTRCGGVSSYLRPAPRGCPWIPHFARRRSRALERAAPGRATTRFGSGIRDRPLRGALKWALPVHPTVVEAASNECKAKPDSAAPAGTRWYYRANRVDHSRCWFLSSSNVSAHSRLRQSTSVTRGHFIRPNAGKVPDAQQNPQVNPQIASAIKPAADGLLSGQTMVPQVTTRAQDPPRSYELLARKVATSPYRLAVASAQPPTGALVQASPSGSQASAGVANFNLLFPRFAARYDCSLDAPEPRRKPSLKNESVWSAQLRNGATFKLRPVRRRFRLNKAHS